MSQQLTATEPQSVDYNISSVTVYSDRADVTRSTTLELSVGKHLLVFEGLPDNTDVSSVRVEGLGDFVLNDIKTQLVYFESTQNQKLAELETQRDGLYLERHKLEAHSQRSEKSEKALEKILKRITTAGKGKEGVEMNFSRLPCGV